MSNLKLLNMSYDKNNFHFSRQLILPRVICNKLIPNFENMVIFRLAIRRLFFRKNLFEEIRMLICTIACRKRGQQTLSRTVK